MSRECDRSFPNPLIDKVRLANRAVAQASDFKWTIGVAIHFKVASIAQYGDSYFSLHVGRANQCFRIARASYTNEGKSNRVIDAGVDNAFAPRLDEAHLATSPGYTDGSPPAPQNTVS